MPKIQIDYFKYRALWRCFCVLALWQPIGSPFDSQQLIAQTLPTSWVQMDVLIPDGILETKSVLAYDIVGMPIADPAWMYVSGSWSTPGHTLPCGDLSHRTSLGNCYQHTHVLHDFPIYDEFGRSITRGMIEAAWRIFFTKRYGGWSGTYWAESGQAELKYNCHSFATGTTSHWNDLIDKKMSDDFQLAYFHHLTTCFSLEQGTNGGFGHSLKFWYYNAGPSGTGVLGTEEKYRESQIFFHAWSITDQNSAPCGTTGPLWTRGVKYKPK